MVTLKRPARLFSFSDWNKDRPKEPPPGDRIDAQFLELIDAITATQDALRDIRRDDGALKNALVGDDQLATNLRAVLIGDIEARVAAIHQSISGIARSAQTSEQNAQLFAEDAERALTVARQMISEWNVIREASKRATDYAQRASDSVDLFATEAEDWANYSKAQADNAIAAKDEALQWAEYLSGPVVDPAQAPAYIADSKFPSGYFYQPVEGSPAGLWSAKWWALYARALVGNTGFYYLGSWDHPPLPGEQNPHTGQTVPDPLTQGSIYYDEGSGNIKVWNGSAWTSPVALAQGFVGHFVYRAIANQTVFFGADLNGFTPSVGSSPSIVCLNGVRLVEGEDFTINAGSSALVINTPVTANSMVQWDLLIAEDKLSPGTVLARKIKPLAFNGTMQDFVLQYVDSGGATLDANVGSGVQLTVSQDGVVQESGKDYTAAGNTIHFIAAPPADAAVWIVWWQPASGAAGGDAVFFDYQAKTISTAIADPGSGFIVWNTAAQTDATKLAISERITDNTDVSGIWNSPGMIGKTIALQKKTDSTNVQRFTITGIIDHTTWFELNVTPISSSGPAFTGNLALFVGVYG